MTTEQARQALAALAATEAAATPPPWATDAKTMAGRVWVALGTRRASGDLEPMFKVRSEPDFKQREADAAEIVVARNMHPGFLAAFDKVLKQAEEILERHRIVTTSDNEDGETYEWCFTCGYEPTYGAEHCPDAVSALALVAAVTDALGGSE
jgi:hypothetical protein